MAAFHILVGNTALSSDKYNVFFFTSIILCVHSLNSS